MPYAAPGPEPRSIAASGVARRTVETLLTGLAGGLAFNFLGLPAGLVSGSVMAVTASSLAGRRLGVHPGLARVIFIMAGIALGSAVSPATLRGIAAYPLSIAILSAATIAVWAATAY